MQLSNGFLVERLEEFSESAYSLLNLATIVADAMATVSFSVPNDVKAAFDRTFKDQNKSAIIADLMRQAVIESNRRKERQEIFRKLTRRRAERPALSHEQIRAARVAGRP